MPSSKTPVQKMLPPTIKPLTQKSVAFHTLAFCPWHFDRIPNEPYPGNNVPGWLSMIDNKWVTDYRHTAVWYSDTTQQASAACMVCIYIGLDRDVTVSGLFIYWVTWVSVYKAESPLSSSHYQLVSNKYQQVCNSMMVMIVSSGGYGWVLLLYIIFYYKVNI